MAAIQPAAASRAAEFFCRTGRVVWSVGIYLALLAVSLLMICQMLPAKFVDRHAYHTAWMNMWLLGTVALVGIIAEMVGWLMRRREGGAGASAIAEEPAAARMQYGSHNGALGAWDLLVGLTFVVMVVLFIGLAANVAYHWARHAWVVLGCVSTCALFSASSGVAAYWRFAGWCAWMKGGIQHCVTAGGCGCGVEKAQ